MSRMSRFHERKEALRKSLKGNFAGRDLLEEGIRMGEKLPPLSMQECRKLAESIRGDSRLAERFRKAGNGRAAENTLLKIAYSYKRLSELFMDLIDRDVCAEFLAQSAKHFSAAGCSSEATNAYFSAAHLMASAEKPKRSAELFLLAGKSALDRGGSVFSFTFKSAFTEAAGIAKQSDSIPAKEIATRALEILKKSRARAEQAGDLSTGLEIGEIAKEFEPFL